MRAHVGLHNHYKLGVADTPWQAYQANSARDNSIYKPGHIAMTVTAI